MIKFSALDSCKSLAETLGHLVPGGIMFCVTEGDTIVWRFSSDSFHLDSFEVGNHVESNGVMMNAVRNKKTVSQNVPRTVYGQRLIIVAMPIIDDTDNVFGAFSVFLPKLHPVAAAFKDFAPVLAEMFDEGSVIYMTDLTQVVYRQASLKFDISSLPVGHVIQEEDVAARTIKTKKPISEEGGAEIYGFPVLETNYPLFDEDNPDEIVASLGVIIPKKTAAHLRIISGNLEDGLSAISAAIEELAAEATSIHSNEQNLNNNIKEIIGLSEEINKVSVFIKEIADETKMLGLNAAIEAARAGESGRGFGVVAEEIRKLSEQSKSTVPRIQELTDTIKAKVNDAGDMSKSSLHASQEQAAATEQVTASIEEITAMCGELNEMAKTL
ncbi:MAG: methyl-accepting chemotaxis protein [Candidatus Dehalobacter alkaniphilus]